MKICVFCSSSDAVDGTYRAAADDLGARIGAGGHTLVYGGGAVGLMGSVARSAHAAGGRVVGIIPSFMNRAGVAYAAADELFVTDGMRERKSLMEAMAEAFIALPGGYGTLEEIAEVITLCTFGVWVKPLVVVNTAGFWAPLIALFELFSAERFAKPEFKAVCAFVEDPAGAMDYIRDFTPPALVSKWF